MPESAKPIPDKRTHPVPSADSSSKPGAPREAAMQGPTPPRDVRLSRALDGIREYEGASKELAFFASKGVPDTIIPGLLAHLALACSKRARRRIPEMVLETVSGVTGTTKKLRQLAADVARLNNAPGTRLSEGLRKYLVHAPSLHARVYARDFHALPRIMIDYADYLDAQKRVHGIVARGGRRVIEMTLTATVMEFVRALTGRYFWARMATLVSAAYSAGECSRLFAEDDLRDFYRSECRPMMERLGFPFPTPPEASSPDNR